MFDAMTLAPNSDFVCGRNRLAEVVNFITQWNLMIAHNEFVWGKDADEKRDKAPLAKEQKSQQSTSKRRGESTQGFPSVQKDRKLVRETIQERITRMVTLLQKGMRHRRRNRRKKVQRLETRISKTLSPIILEMKK